MRRIHIGAGENDDQEFIIDIYKAYYGLVKKTIVSLTGVHSDVDDLINDSFLKLIEKASTLRGLSSGRLTAYIKYTARSVAINFLKHQTVVTKHVDSAAETDLPDYGSDRGTMWTTGLFRSMSLSCSQEPFFSCRKKRKTYCILNIF